jgi:hypothetical protein
MALVSDQEGGVLSIEALAYWRRKDNLLPAKFGGNSEKNRKDSRE